MQQILRTQSRTLLLMAIAGILLASPIHAQLQDRGDGLWADPEAGLVWVADARLCATALGSERLVLPRAEALRLIAKMNAGEIDNFGHQDWRLPTRREFQRLFAAGGGDLERLGDSVSFFLQTSLEGAAKSKGAKSGLVPDLSILWPVRGYTILPGFSDVVLFATHSARIKNDARVESGNVVVNDASSQPTLVSGFELGLDPKSSTAAGSAVKADSLQVKNKATIEGDATYNNVDNKGSILGASTSPLGLPVFASLPPFRAQAPAPASPDVTVAAGGFDVLPAGDYGALSIGEGGTLVLAGGTYNVASITTAEDASLLFRSPVAVRVEGRVLTGKNTVLGPEDALGPPASEVVLYVAGINGADGALDSVPRAAEIGPDNQIQASFFVANGLLRIDHGTVATGAFLARDLLLENRAVLNLDSYFFNRPPVAGDDSLTVDEGATATVLDSAATSVLDNDTDANDDPLTVTVPALSGPDHGVLTLNGDGTFSYTHDGSETTSDSFVYEVCDDGVPALCDTATVSITINPINDPPTAVDDSMTVGQGETTTVLDSSETSVLANDSDPDSTTLTVTTPALSGPSSGSLTLNSDGTFEYIHNGSEGLSDSFQYEVCDDGAPIECSTATVSITILPRSTITVVKFGLGTGTVTSSPAGIDCGATCAAEYAGGTVVTLTATPTGTSVFGGFSGDADCADGVVTADSDKTCLARFDASSTPAVLTVTTAGGGSGRVTSSPAGIDCPGTCSAGFPIPSRVSLTPEADSGSVFVGWSGAADCADGELSLIADTTCTATFEEAPAILHVVKFGTGDGTVTSTPAGIDCGSTCSADFTGEASVTLTATPDAGSTFGGFSGDPDCADGVITPDAEKTCFVRFSSATSDATLTITTIGGGRVVSDPAGIDCPGTCSADFPAPSLIDLTPIPDAGFAFADWSGDPACESSLRFVQATSCTATFAALPAESFTLTLVFIGGGSGSVSATPPGTFCTSGCTLGPLVDGTVVSLSARPDFGSFGGWGGDCSGAGFSTSVTLDADKTCTVSFLP